MNGRSLCAVAVVSAALLASCSREIRVHFLNESGSEVVVHGREPFGAVRIGVDPKGEVPVVLPNRLWIQRGEEFWLYTGISVYRKFAVKRDGKLIFHIQVSTNGQLSVVGKEAVQLDRQPSGWPINPRKYTAQAVKKMRGAGDERVE